MSIHDAEVVDPAYGVLEAAFGEEAELHETVSLGLVRNANVASCVAVIAASVLVCLLFWQAARERRAARRERQDASVCASSTGSSTRSSPPSRTSFARRSPRSAATSSFSARARPASSRPRKGVSLELGVPPMPPLVGDRVRLVQLLDNLISNAVKVTPAGGRVEVVGCVEGDRPC